MAMKGFELFSCLPHTCLNSEKDKNKTHNSCPPVSEAKLCNYIRKERAVKIWDCELNLQHALTIQVFET